MKLTKDQLTNRCKELIAIRDSADPMIQMINSGTTNINETISGLKPQEVGTIDDEQPTYVSERERAELKQNST